MNRLVKILICLLVLLVSNSAMAATAVEGLPDVEPVSVNTPFPILIYQRTGTDPVSGLPVYFALTAYNTGQASMVRDEQTSGIDTANDSSPTGDRVVTGNVGADEVNRLRRRLNAAGAREQAQFLPPVATSDTLATITFQARRDRTNTRTFTFSYYLSGVDGSTGSQELDAIEAIIQAFIDAHFADIAL